jgi:hypothetical protein
MVLNRTNFITAASFVDESGFGCHRSARRWETALEKDGAEFSWQMISNAPFPRFGRLDAMSRYAVAAAELLALPAAREGEVFARMGICLGTETGSLGVDIEFFMRLLKLGEASPTLFVYTLPSAAIAEIAIRHHIMGPNTSMADGRASGLLALWEGLQLIQSRELDQCVCIECEAVSHAAAPFVAELAPPAEAVRRYARAFLLETEQSAKGRDCTALAEISIKKNGGHQCPDGPGALGVLYRYLVDGEQQPEPLRLPAPESLQVPEIMVITKP